MRRLVFVALLCFTAGAMLFAVDAVPSPDQQTVATPAGPAAAEGWRTDAATYPLAGGKLPAFAAKPDNGPDISNESLRGRWTIIGFQSPGDAADEGRYISALNSAVDQDPDLDFLLVYRIEKGSLLEIPPYFPAIRDDQWKIAKALQVGATPAYLLVGPDLTIHAYRGALSSDPDGIKAVIRGVAGIRKNVARPQ
jgi:hypothetical protein